MEKGLGKRGEKIRYLELKINDLRDYLEYLKTEHPGNNKIDQVKEQLKNYEKELESNLLEQNKEAALMVKKIEEKINNIKSRGKLWEIRERIEGKFSKLKNTWISLSSLDFSATSLAALDQMFSPEGIIYFQTGQFDSTLAFYLASSVALVANIFTGWKGLDYLEKAAQKDAEDKYYNGDKEYKKKIEEIKAKLYNKQYYE